MPLEIEAPTMPRQRTDALLVALVNNMPDAALTATESQFASLLAAASGTLRIRLRLTSLPEVPREAQSLAYIQDRYWTLETVLDDPPDAIIVTGTEPRASALEQEPYWSRLVQLLEWTQSRTTSSIWSCLAAHAAVQALDGIRRRRLSEKRFGVFEHTPLPGVPLLAGVGAPVLTPHSRWNDLPIDELRAAGYIMASASPQSGVDMFLREERALMVCFQGHPEYQSATLLKEYRRDVARYLRGERELWPTLPHGYFSAAALAALRAFRQRAEPRRDPLSLEDFPQIELGTDRQAPWRPAAVHIYRNWLAYLAGTRSGAHSRRRVTV
jgi:homoserine O-succinyltransferase